LGYNVALPGARNRHGDPVWYPGSKLAPDLSLPKIRLRLAEGTVEQAAPSAAEGRPEWSPPARARRSATSATERAAVLLDGDADDEESAAQLAGVGELLDAVAQTSPADTRAELAAAARAFERATRSHVRAERADTRALRSAARGIIQAGGALGRGEDGGTTAMLVSTLVLVTLAAARWHSARGHAQQAHASRQAAEHLRTAYRQAAATPMRVLHDQGRALPEAQRRAHEATLRAVLPDQGVRAGGVSAKTDALAATLAQAEQAGHDPEALLKQAIDLRELATAENVNDVLVWRLRRIAQLPAHAGETPHRPPAGIQSNRTSANRTSGRNVPTAAPRPAVFDPRSRPPRR
ncbi:mobilization protein, partial [Streptomyces roseolus]